MNNGFIVGSVVICLTPAITACSGGSTSEIAVKSASYGRNCSAKPLNPTKDLQTACDAKSTCDYKVDATKIGDPAGGCAKDFSVEYTCGANSAVRTANIPGEASGQSIHLSCP